LSLEVSTWFRGYNRQRLHQSLNYRTADEIYEQRRIEPFRRGLAASQNSAANVNISYVQIEESWRSLPPSQRRSPAAIRNWENRLRRGLSSGFWVLSF